MRRRLLDRPETEYFDGAANAKVSPKTRHALVQAALVRILARCAGSRGFTGTEWRFRLTPHEPQTVLIPDAAFISAERLRPIPAALRDEPPVAPDIAIEVRSPSDDLRYLRAKIERYLQTGALAVIEAEPAVRTLTAHTASHAQTFHDGDRFAIARVPWLQFDVPEAFAVMDAFDRL